MSSQPLGEAFIPIRATLDKLDKDLAGARSKVKGALDGISANVKKAGKIAVAGVATGVIAIGAGIAAIASQAIPAASNLNEALNATSVVFGDSADIVQAFGETAADSAGMSEAAFNQLAATTGAMLQNYGLSADQAAESTVDLAQRAADMASIFNTDVDEAMTAINAAMRGEADPIERFGVSMNAAAVEAKAMAMGLADTTSELDQAALTQARLALLFEQTDAIAGDFVNTSDQLANAARVQSARWENFMADLGAFALPILTELQTLFMDLAEMVLPLVLNAVGPVMDIFGGLVSNFVVFIEAVAAGQDPIASLQPLIYNLGLAFGLTSEESMGLVTQFQDLIAWVQETAAQIAEMIAPVWEAITGFVEFQDVLIALGAIVLSFIIPTIISLVTSMLPIILTVGALIAIVALLRNAWESDWGGIRTNLTAWWNETGKPIFDLLKEWLGVFIPEAISTLKHFWDNVLMPAMEAVWSWLTNVLIPFLRDDLIPWVSEKVTAAIQTLTDYWTDTLKPALEAVWQFIQDDLIPLFEALWDLFNVAGTLALEALAGLWQNILKPALEAVWQFIQDDLIPIFDRLRENINRDLKPVLEWLSDTVLSGLEDSFLAVKNAIQKTVEKVKSLINKIENFELPDWLTPGSPTPFELGLIGINNALTDFNRLLDENGLIGSPSMSVNPTLNPALAGMAGDSAGSSTSYQANTTIYTNQDPLRVLRASRHLDKISEIPE